MIVIFPEFPQTFTWHRSQVNSRKTEDGVSHLWENGPQLSDEHRFYLVLYSHQNLSCLKSGADFSGFTGNVTVEE